jgi:hypothetical protein
MSFGYVVGATPAVETASWISKLLKFPGGRPNRSSPLKICSCWPSHEFLQVWFFFFWGLLYLLLKMIWIEINRLNIWWKKFLWKNTETSKIFIQWKKRKGKGKGVIGSKFKWAISIGAPSRKFEKLWTLTRRLHRSCRPTHVSKIHNLDLNSSWSSQVNEKYSIFFWRTSVAGSVVMDPRTRPAGSSGSRSGFPVSGQRRTLLEHWAERHVQRLLETWEPSFLHFSSEQ